MTRLPRPALVEDAPVCGAQADTRPVDVLHLASSLEGCPVMRVEWYFEASLGCCGGMTAHELVAAGRGHEVMEFLHRAIYSEEAELRIDAR